MKKSLLKLTLGISALALSANVSAQCVTGPDTLFFTGTVDTWTVPAGVTSLSIEVRGAEGGTGSSSTNTGGLGAIMVGEFTVTPGDILNVLIGETPATSNGGGGGTFVTDVTNSPMIVAGGGGGSSSSVDDPTKHADTLTTGQNAPNGGIGGTTGNGGAIGATFAAGAGGGLLTNGADGWIGNTGGKSFLNGGSVTTNGGFGGGGSGSGYVVGGGGGGYSGGGGGSNSVAPGVGGGGGSYNNGTNQLNTAGTNTGNGMVIINYALSIDTSTTLNGLTISSNEITVGATYRWLDCSNSYAVIPNDTNQTYTAITNGSYAVEATLNGCADTSSCITFNTIGINESALFSNVNIYPNPTNDIININWGKTISNITLTLSSIDGRIVYQKNNLNNQNLKLNLSNNSKGIYLLKLESKTSVRVLRIIKK